MNGILAILKRAVRINKSGSDSRIILLHGSLAHIFDKDGAFSQISADDRLVREISARAPASLLLASPYIKSFVHETIHLSGRDLERAERYKLPFNQTGERGIIHSVALNDKRALTVHSRFGPKGSDLLNSLRKSSGVSWRPAIFAFIQNLLSFPSDVFRRKDYLRIYLREEVLRACWSGASPEFKNFYYWRPELDFEPKKRRMDELLNDGQGEETATEIVFDRLDEASSGRDSLVGKLLYPDGNKLKLRVCRRVLKEKPEKRAKTITLNRVLIGTGLVLAGGAAVANFQLFQTKREYLDLQRELASFRARSESFKQIAETERAYFKLSSFWEALGRLHIKPDAILKKLDSILPTGVWIYRISISLETITLDLLDNSKKTELSKLIESLNDRLGKTALETNETTLFGNTSLKKYRLIINYSNTDIGDEKMDKKREK